MVSNRPRVLHIVDPAAPDAGPCTLRGVAAVVDRLRAFAHEVIVLGARREESLAIRCGLRPAGRVSLPCGVPRLGPRALLRAMRSLEAGGPLLLVHPWSRRANRLADRAGAAFRSVGLVPAIVPITAPGAPAAPVPPAVIDPSTPVEGSPE